MIAVHPRPWTGRDPEAAAVGIVVMVVGVIIPVFAYRRYKARKLEQTGSDAERAGPRA